ncbi:hypothetical protein [Chromobacterium amazonense]|uniref:hypothetical protein n=1 Tax=Chromobacterium amazonense TaxID=1382803 RepID=UPI003F7B3261
MRNLMRHLALASLLLGPVQAVMAGCGGLVVGAYTQKSGRLTYQYLCISNANYDDSRPVFVSGGCPPNSFPIKVAG